MLTNNKLSVIMALYNAEKYLNECMDSLLSQSFGDFSLLCMFEKSSDDGTLDILNSYAARDGRVKIIHNQGFEKSLAGSLNQGLIMADGEYIARMDADDVCDMDRFKIELEFLDSYKDIDVVGSCVHVIGDLSEEQRKFDSYRLNIPLNPHNARETMLSYWYCFSNSSAMFRRPMLDSIGLYRQSNADGEDFEFWLRALRKGHKIHKLQQRLVTYRIHSDSLLQKQIARGTAASDGFRMKLDDVFLGRNVKEIPYLIWGVGMGGEMTKVVLDSRDELFVCKGFIDTYKTGTFMDYEIYKPDELPQIEYDYLFIATVTGKEFAFDILTKLCKENIKDYLCSV